MVKSKADPPYGPTINRIVPMHVDAIEIPSNTRIKVLKSTVARKENFVHDFGMGILTSEDVLSMILV
jgi:hypothetical protein